MIILYLKKIQKKNHEINIGKPTVAVVINAPAKIIKGRQGKFFKANRNFYHYIGIYTVCPVNRTIYTLIIYFQVKNNAKKRIVLVIIPKPIKGPTIPVFKNLKKLNFMCLDFSI